jgi:hypothetical protein
MVFLFSVTLDEYVTHEIFSSCENLPPIKQSTTDMKPDPDEIGFVYGQPICEWSHKQQKLHMNPLFVRLPDAALGYFVAAGKRTMSSTRIIYVCSLVSGTKRSSGGIPRQDACTFKEWLEQLSDIIIELCVTGKGYF